MANSTLSRMVLRSVQRYYALFGFRGVLKRAISGILPGQRNFEAIIPQSGKTVLLRIGTTDVDAFEQVFINREYQFNLEGDPSVIIDAGANVGMSSVFFSLSYPKARIIAIEPDPTNFEILKENAKRFSNIKPINVALWSHKSVVSLSSSNGGHWGVRVVGESSSAEKNTNAQSLSSILEENNILKVDILKVDIEGSELELFEDPSAWIDRVNFICAELHDRFRPGCSRVFETATLNFSKKWVQGELKCAHR
jgi:FkbM family methyltransferase